MFGFIVGLARKNEEKRGFLRLLGEGRKVVVLFPKSKLATPVRWSLLERALKTECNLC